MKLHRYCVLSALVFFVACQAAPAQPALVQNPEFDRTIRQYLDFTIPVITCQELKETQEDIVLLDARERDEFEVSHITGAKHIGFKKFNREILDSIPKNSHIVVYCSIGYRSEKIGEKLQDLGYQNVSNLYGSIFEWVNQGLPVVDPKGNPTNKIHTYNKSWSRWVEGEQVSKEW